MTSTVNVAVTGKTLEKFPDIVPTLALIKKAFATTNEQFGFLSKTSKDAIVKACDDIIAHTPDALNIELWQSDFSLLNDSFNRYVSSHYDVSETDVNLLQSVADTSQTIESIVVYRRLQKTITDVGYLEQALRGKALEYKNEWRLTRTKLAEGAVGTWGQTFGALAVAVNRCKTRLEDDLPLFSTSVLGSSMFGFVHNKPNAYSQKLLENLSEMTGFTLQSPTAKNETVDKSALIDELMGNERLMYLSGDLKVLSLLYAKIGHGFFIYGSGPRAGIAEIVLPGIAPGSTIMPGKINPSMAHLTFQIAEFVAVNEQMASFAVNELDFDFTHQMGGAFITAIETLEILGKGSVLFTDKCLAGFSVKSETNLEHVQKAYSWAKLLSALYGQDAADRVLCRMKREDCSCESACIEEKLLTKSEASALFDLERLTDEGLSVELLSRYFRADKGAQ